MREHTWRFQKTRVLSQSVSEASLPRPSQLLRGSAGIIAPLHHRAQAGELTSADRSRQQHEARNQAKSSKCNRCGTTAHIEWRTCREHATFAHGRLTKFKRSPHTRLDPACRVGGPVPRAQGARLQAQQPHRIQDSSLSNGRASAARPREQSSKQKRPSNPTQTREPSTEGARVHQRRGTARCSYQQPSATSTQDSPTRPWLDNVQCTSSKKQA